MKIDCSYQNDIPFDSAIILLDIYSIDAFNVWNNFFTKMWIEVVLIRNKLEIA